MPEKPLLHGPNLTVHTASLRWFGLACVAIAAALAGCSSVDGLGARAISGITPYKVEIVQGNFVSREQVALLQPGMARAQVREVLGSPMLTSLFHADRWDYVFTLRRQGVEPVMRRLTVFFKADLFDHTEGDTMPTEAEFVAQINTRRNFGKAPSLEGSEEALKQFSAKNEAAVAAPNASAGLNAAPLPTSYPPLEPAR